MSRRRRDPRNGSGMRDGTLGGKRTACLACRHSSCRSLWVVPFVRFRLSQLCLSECKRRDAVMLFPSIFA